jgi:hypothetical protein
MYKLWDQTWGCDFTWVLCQGQKNLRLDGMGVQTTTWELVVNFKTC